MDNLVKIIIPIYKTDLDATEIIALKQCKKVLKDYPMVIVKPDSLDISVFFEQFGYEFEVECFDDSFFVGIAGYNRLMLSSEFYERFQTSEYILIYQLDAYVFRDELRIWCDRNYDYIGAPWLCKLKYRHPFFKSFLYLRGMYYLWTGIKHRQQCFYKVGNGGLSLRKVASCLRKMLEMKTTIEYYLANTTKSSQFNEDVFWALEATKANDFKLPKWQEALKFSFDLFPEVAYGFTQNQLPFGCHRWNKQHKFWKEFIEFPE